jgi:hypothetical protein
MGMFNSQSIKHTKSVVRQVRQVIWGVSDFLTFERCGNKGKKINLNAIEFRGETSVSVIESDDLEPSVSKHPTKIIRPVDQLCP